jgi:hypothetical protein
MQKRPLSLVTIIFLILGSVFFGDGLAAGKGEKGDGRVVAVGDVHGGLQGLTRILRTAGLIDSSGDWNGGRATLVSVGDLVDRGSDDLAVIELFMQLEKQAKRKGGVVHIIMGNHEAMNIMGDLRYVAVDSYAKFADDKSQKRRQKALKTYKRYLESRAQSLKQPGLELSPKGEEEWLEEHPLGYVEHRASMSAGGRYGKWFRQLPTTLRLRDIMFVHGGLHPSITLDGKTINKVIKTEIRAFDQLKKYLLDNKIILPFFDLEEMTNAVLAEIESIKQSVEPGQALPPATLEHLDLLERFPRYVNWLSFHQDGPLWFRGFANWSDEEGAPQIEALSKHHQVNHFVVGHTPQLPRQIRVRFDGKVLLIDTGMLSSYYEGGGPAALEIKGTSFTAIYPEKTQVVFEVGRDKPTSD